MNRRVWCCVGLLPVIAWFNRTSMAQAPATGAPAAPTIPLGAQQAADASSFQPQIHTYVTKYFADLASTDKAVRSVGRKQLIVGCPKGVTSSYAAIYGKEVNAGAAATLTGVKPMPLRMNVALVLYSVAANGDTLEVEPEVQILLDDRDAAVSYWAVKACEPLVKVLTAKQQLAGSKLIPAIVACSQKHTGTDPLSGDIAEDAYKALTPSEIEGISTNDLKSLVKPLIDPVLDLTESRMKLFATEMIADPGAEKIPANFLSGNYSVMTEQQQHRTVQDLVTLITDLGVRAADYETDQNTAAKTDVSKRELMSLVRATIKTSASALVVVCNNPSIATALEWLIRIPPSSTAAEILAHTGLVFGQVQTVPDFKYLVAPAALPALTPVAPPAAPVVTPAKTPAAA